MGDVGPVLTQAMGLGAPVVGQTLMPLVARGALGYMDYRSRSDQAEAEQRTALQELQQKQQLQANQLASQNALEREQIAVQAQASERERQSALRRAVARQRALFGSSGLGNSGDGSSSAVLLGMFDESQDELAQRERLDNLRTRALDLSESNLASTNVLQRTQLQERQKLQKVSWF